MSDKKLKFAIVLSGCGFLDGAEIQESTMTMLAVCEAGGTYQIFAPDIAQYHVINHLTGQPSAEVRNVLVEAARIARGKARPLSEFKAREFDALLFPGGFGAAKNLSTFAFDGASCTVNADVQASVQAMLKAGKPIGALCISPAVIAKIVSGARVTVGADEEANEQIARMGSSAQNTGHGQIVIDEEHKIVSAPCYMLESSVDEIALDAREMVKAVIRLAER